MESKSPIKTFRWSGEQISYHENNLVPLVARCTHIANSGVVRHLETLIEEAFGQSEELLYGDWLKIKERLNVYL